MNTFDVISPINDKIYKTFVYSSKKEIDAVISSASRAQEFWFDIGLSKRKEYISKFLDVIESLKEEIASELTWQIGRPISFTMGELNTFRQRADYLVEVADKALEDYKPDHIKGYDRYIEKIPLGLVFLLSPWNYPFLTSINILIPALLAGNCLIFKTSSSTPLVSKRYEEAFNKANLPKGVFSSLYLSHENTDYLLKKEEIQAVFFTGSKKGALSIQESIKEKFINCVYELGGKDAAYVRSDADIDIAVKDLVDGAFFNSGQSCCSIERIYVHEKVYQDFVRRFVDLTKTYILDNPSLKKTTLGPMISKRAREKAAKEINEAVKLGAKSLLSEKLFPASEKGTSYLSPHILVNVKHNMTLMKSESFAPLVGIMKVLNDEEALYFMNDSIYGLSASIYTQDIKKAKNIAKRLKVGTVFLNKCDYLDPALAWGGVKESGKGISLSVFAYESVSRLKSFNFKL